MINQSVFRQYDIRGNSFTDITPQFAYKIGYFFAKMNLNNNLSNLICIGRDGRHSSNNIHQALASGLSQGGASVVSIGLVPTPMLYFASKHLNATAGIMVTASHNPKDDNGFKMLVNNKAFYGLQIQELYKLISSENLDIHLLPDQYTNIDLSAEYLNKITNNLNLHSNLKIAWDPGNGAACNILKLLLPLLPNHNIVINGEIDSNFAGRSPDPTKEGNLNELINVIQNNKCDLGIAFDGDADRLVIITSTGQVISGDKLLCIFAKDIINKSKESKIIVDIKTSQMVIEQIISYGGHPIIWKTGHCFIKEKMLEQNSVLGGEVSGHMFFADKYYGYDDGIYAALRVIELIITQNRTIDAMLKDLPIDYSSPEIKFKVTEDKKFKVINNIKTYLTNQHIIFNDIDGVRVTTDSYWWLLRASNTESFIVVRYGANNQHHFEQLKFELPDLINKFLHDA